MQGYWKLNGSGGYLAQNPWRFAPEEEVDEARRRLCGDATMDGRRSSACEKRESYHEAVEDA